MTNYYIHNINEVKETLQSIVDSIHKINAHIYDASNLIKKVIGMIEGDQTKKKLDDLALKYFNYDKIREVEDCITELLEASKSQVNKQLEFEKWLEQSFTKNLLFELYLEEKEVEIEETI
jgi:hypothetical protein